MENYERLSKEELIDLLKAYDCYITTAVDAGRMQTGWAPVCLAEFYSCEYQDVWRAGQKFDYMYDAEESQIQTERWFLAAFNGVQIFSEKGTLMCQSDGEEQTRLIRSRIQDIRDGDAFFIGTGLHYADGAAHQNLDEPDNPWVVFDVGGDGWFEEDIGKPSVCIAAILLSQQRKEASKPTLDDLIHGAEDGQAAHDSASQINHQPRPQLR